MHILNIEAVGLMVFEKFFPIIRLMTLVVWPIRTQGIWFVGDHLTLLYTKYIS